MRGRLGHGGYRARPGSRCHDAAMDWTKGDYTITTDPSRIDAVAIRRFLAASYWAPDRPIEVIERSLAGSLSFALLHAGRQVGMARVVTDRATFAWLCDVYVEPGHRGSGIGAWLVSVVVGHPELADVTTWMLSSRDARDLYARFGFTSLPHPEQVMIRRTGPPVT